MKIVNKTIFLILFLAIIFTNNLSLNNLKSLDLNSNSLNQYNQRLTNHNRIKLHEVVDKEHYILGPGDELHINFISNNFLINNYFIISPSGDLIIPSLGMINLNNLSLIDAILSIKTLFYCNSN